MSAPAVFGPLSGAPVTPRNNDELALVIEQQCGVVEWSQCISGGMTPKAIQVRLERGRWVRLHHGVYLTIPGRDTWQTKAIGALMACGADAALSHQSAAFLWGMEAKAPLMVDVLIPHRRRLVPPTGVRLHRSAKADSRADDRAWPWRTTVENTILDIGALGSADNLFAVLGRAFQKNLTTEAAVRHALDARHRHRWGALLQTVLDDAGSGVESAMEVRYLQDVERAHGLPPGVRQLPTDADRRRYHDVAYPEQRLLVELDGRLGHEDREARVKDGVRDRKSAVSGWLTVRAFWTDVTVGCCALAAEVASILESRGSTAAPVRCLRKGCVVGKGQPTSAGD